MLDPHNKDQLYRLLLDMSGEIEQQRATIATLQRQLAEATANGQALTADDIYYIRNQLSTGGIALLNITGLPGLAGQSQRAYALTAASAAELPDPSVLEVGTIGAVVGGSTITFYLVQAGNPRSWAAQTTLSITAIDNAFTIQDDADSTKKLAFDVGALVATGNTRTMTVPDVNQILAGRNVDNAFSVTQSVTNALDANLFLDIINTNAVGTSAAGAVRAGGSTARVRLQGHGTARTLVRCGVTLGDWNELFASAGNGILIDTAGATAIVFGTNDVERVRINDTGIVVTSGQITSSTQYGCLAYHNTTQSVADATITALALNSESYDRGSLHDTAVNNTRMTIPADGGGTWLLIGQASFAAAATGTRHAYIYRNGATQEALVYTPTLNPEASRIQVCALVSAAAADYFELAGYQNSGAALNTVANQTFLAAHKLC